MEHWTPIARLVSALAIAYLTLWTMPIKGQITTSCTSSMISTFTPCINYITSSSPNITSPSPTSDCCTSLKSLMGTGMDCLCLIVTGNVPFQVPINRTLAVSLPRACKMTGVPVQCKASAAPIPAPGPVALGPTLSPNISNTPSVAPPTLAPEADTTPNLTPPADSGVPTASNTGSRPVLTPSAASSLIIVSPALLLLTLGSVLSKIY